MNCSVEDLDNSEELTNISVMLKSTSTLSDKVYLDFQDVQFRVLENELNPNAWYSLGDINKGVQNVTDANDTNLIELVDNLDIKTNDLYELRLVLGDNNFLDIHNVLYAIHTLDNDTDDNKNLVETRLNPNTHYDIIIDLDLEQSIRYNEEDNTRVVIPKFYTEIRHSQY